MDTVVFNKEDFKKSVLDNVKNIYRKNIDEATKQQVFQAVAYAVKDMIIDRWIATQKEYEKQDVKTVYYMSMEFLMGRALGNNMINLCCYKEVKEVLEELGFDINVIEDQEPDAALATEPSILLSDESTSALDPKTTKAILKLLKKINRELKITIVLITHEMNVIQSICNHVAVMENGRIVERGEVLEVFSEPKQEITRNFVKTVINDSVDCRYGFSDCACNSE